MSDFAPIDLLFVPADRPDRFGKALSAASAVCIDLEDAVAQERKVEARRLLAGALDAGLPGLDRLVVRIQAVGAPGHAEDLAMLSAHAGLRAIMLPKADSGDAIAPVVGQLAAGVGVIGLVETARGLRQAAAIAAAPGVIGLALGALDLAAELGAVFSGEDRDHFRRQLRLAGAEAGVACWNSPWPDILDSEGLTEEARRSAALGFAGMLCIHPSQVAPVRAAFAPSPEEVARARDILAVPDGGVVQAGGIMIDAPVFAGARRILDRHARLSALNQGTEKT